MKKMKKVTTLLFACTLLVPNSSIFADQLEANQQSTNELSASVANQQDVTVLTKDLDINLSDNQKVTQESLNLFNQMAAKKRQNISTIQRIKLDPDFEVIFDDGQGSYSYTSSKNVKTKEDKDRFLRKCNEFSAQGANSVYGSRMITRSYCEFYDIFNDSEKDTDVSGYEEITVNGSGHYDYYPAGPNAVTAPQKWASLTSIQDSFTFNYSYVGNVLSNVTVGGKIGTSGGEVSGSASTTWNTLNASSTCTVNWPSSSNKDYYNRVYSGVYLRTDNVTGYTHQAAAIATVNGEYLMINAPAYQAIS